MEKDWDLVLLMCQVDLMFEQNCHVFLITEKADIFDFFGRMTEEWQTTITVPLFIFGVMFSIKACIR